MIEMIKDAIPNTPFEGYAVISAFFFIISFVLLTVHIFEKEKFKYLNIFLINILNMFIVMILDKIYF